MTKGHALFDCFPKSDDVAINGRSYPIPYRVFDGNALFLTGRGQLDALNDLIGPQDVQLVPDSSGNAALGLFVCRFDDASMGPHLEFHLVALASGRPGLQISDEAEAMLAALGSVPGVGLLSVRLWNDTDPVLDLNREYFGLQPEYAGGSVGVDGQWMTFEMADVSGKSLLSGHVARKKRPEIAPLWRMLRLMGLRAFAKAGREKSSEAWIISRKGTLQEGNRWARTVVAPDWVSVMAFRSGRDRLEVTSPELQALKFQPRLMQHIAPFRFVYLHPDASDPPKT